MEVIQRSDLQGEVFGGLETLLCWINMELKKFKIKWSEASNVQEETFPWRNECERFVGKVISFLLVPTIIRNNRQSFGYPVCALDLKW